MAESRKEKVMKGEMYDMILGMKRALNTCENCDGDLDFAIFAIKKDIELLSEESDDGTEVDHG